MVKTRRPLGSLASCVNGEGEEEESGAGDNPCATPYHENV